MLTGQTAVLTNLCTFVVPEHLAFVTLLIWNICCNGNCNAVRSDVPSLALERLCSVNMCDTTCTKILLPYNSLLRKL